MAAPIDPDNLAPGTSVGVYRVLRRVGAGGFGTLYEVERDGRRYALKLARERLDGLSPDARKTFENRTDREVAALKSLRHPNIVSIYAVDRWPELETGYPFLVMEFVEGQRLLPWCTTAKPTLTGICEVFEKISAAVHYMHERQLFHRDLKSENVLVRDDGEPVLIDFGIARARSAFRVTGYADVVGTATHYAPEYLKHVGSEAFERGEDFEWTAATDLHSVGYMLYQALTGRPPFEGRTDPELWKAIQSVRPVAPSLVNPKAPGALDELVLRLLEKDPRDRFQSGEDLAQAIRRVRKAKAEETEWAVPFSPAGAAPGEAPRSAATAAHRARKPVRAAAAESDIAPIQSSQPAAPRISNVDDFLASTPLMKALERGGAEEERLPDSETAGAFSPPTSAKAQFVAPEVQAEAQPRPAERSGIPSVVRRAKEQLGDSEKAKKSAIPRPALLGLGLVAGLLVFFVVLGATENPPPKEESLLAKVERREPPSTLPPAAPLPPPPSPATPPSESRPDTVAAPGAEPAVREEPLAPPRPTGTGKGGGTAARGGAKPASSDPEWMQRSRPLHAGTATLKAPAALGIPTGAHIPVKLLTTLDSRTIGNGPVEARLSRPFAVRGEVVLPAGTLIYGQASAGDGRFTIRFARLRLPDDREVEFAGLALDREDGKAGLAASRRLSGPQVEGDGLGTTIAKGTAGIVLGTVTGGLPQDVARSAGQTALGHRSSPSTLGGDALILDPGATFDIWVERPF